jgi:hypothetical protein
MAVVWADQTGPQWVEWWGVPTALMRAACWVETRAVLTALERGVLQAARRAVPTAVL